MLIKGNAYDVAFQVGKHTGMVKELFNDKSAEGLARYENVQELLNSIKEWVDTQKDLAIINEDGEVLIDISASMEEIAKVQQLPEPPAMEKLPWRLPAKYQFAYRCR
jgi:DNA helicase II / ATP-dependent DNA helicase PcrA